MGGGGGGGGLEEIDRSIDIERRAHPPSPQSSLLLLPSSARVGSRR